MFSYATAKKLDEQLSRIKDAPLMEYYGEDRPVVFIGGDYMGLAMQMHIYDGRLEAAIAEGEAPYGSAYANKDFAYDADGKKFNASGEEVLDEVPTVENKMGAYRLSEQKDEYGSPFVVNSKGSIDFGGMPQESGLPSMPIRLSLGSNTVDENGGNHGYGVTHIAASRGEQLKNLGFDTVDNFVEYVAENFTVIRKGSRINDAQTYLLEAPSGDKNDTLFVELSDGGDYWTVNSAGHFRKGYSEGKPVIWSLPTLGDSSKPVTAVVNSGDDERLPATSETPHRQPVSGHKDNTNRNSGKENTGDDSSPEEKQEPATPLTSYLEPKKEVKGKKLEDFGEKIGGARKDVVRKYADKINPSADTFGKMFPTPDIKELLDAGLSMDKAAAVKALYDMAKGGFNAAKKHRGKDFALRGARFYAMYAKDALLGEIDYDKAYNGLIFTDYGKEHARVNISAYQKLFAELGTDYAAVDLSDYDIRPLDDAGRKALGSDNEFHKRRHPERVYKDAGKIAFVMSPSLRPENQFETLEEAIDAFIGKVRSGVDLSKVNAYEIGIYNPRDARGLIDYSKAQVCAKIRGYGAVALMEFGNVSEARKWLNEHEQDAQQMAAARHEQLKNDKSSRPLPKYRIEYTKQKGKYVVVARFSTKEVPLKEFPYEGEVYGRGYIKTYNDEVFPYMNSQEAKDAADEAARKILDEKNAPKPGQAKTEKQSRERKGKNWRGGQDVTPEMMVDIEGKPKSTFGFRAVEFGNYVTAKERQEFLNDVYDALMDLSEITGVSPRALSLNGKPAIAIGARGIGGASGHFEPAKNVINITKTSGRGVLAHEWLHALDTYFSDYDPNGIYMGGAPKATKGNFKEGTRPEMKEAYKNLMQAIRETDYYGRSEALGDYWSENTELASRAFQDYTIRRLDEKGMKNDFLSNHIPPEEWNGDAKTYPFPIGEEVAAIGDAFDKLFGAFKEKEENGQTVLYQLSKNPESTDDSRDKEYMAAVESGDVEKAARTVREAAADWMGTSALAKKRVRIIDAPAKHGFANIKAAREWAKSNITGTYDNPEIGEVSISGTAIEKYLSMKAVSKSDDLDVHLSTLQVLPEVIKSSIVGESHADNGGNPSLKDIVRLFGAVSIDGTAYRVKTTVKRYADSNTKTKAYSYEVTEIEMLGADAGDSLKGSLPESSSISISGANLMKGVKRHNTEEYILPESTKIVDENGDPLVVYHGTDEEFNAFDWTKGRTGMDIAGMFFTPSEREAKDYGKNVKAFYLDIKNPASASVAYEVFDKYKGEDYAGAIARQELINMGYDGVIMEGEEYIAFEPSQIKSAEPVTRDGNGNVIPLSERFGESDDIRYQLTPRQAEETLAAVANAKTYQPDTEERFQLTKRNSETIDKLLAKNPSIDERGVAAFKTYVEHDDAVAQLAMAKWFGNGSVRLPEDRPLVDEALKVCRKDKSDPMRFATPGDIVKDWQERNSDDEDREYLSPDNYPGVLTNKKDYGNGIVVYDVQDSKKGQQAVRDLMNDHLKTAGKPYYNCWCLEYASESTGELTSQARDYWKHYNSCKKRAAFYKGRIVAFCASDSSNSAEWWDLSDKSHGELIPVEMAVPGDRLGRSAMSEFDPEDNTVTPIGKLFKGNKKNGLYREWFDEDRLYMSNHYKGGALDGLYEQWYSNGQLAARANYKGNKRDGLREQWYDNGQLAARANYKGGKKDGLCEQWYDNGQLWIREHYKGGEKDGVVEIWNDQGELWTRRHYKDDELDGLEETWYENGQRKKRYHYKDGKRAGLQEEWFENGKRASIVDLYTEYAIKSFFWNKDGSVYKTTEGMTPEEQAALIAKADAYDAEMDAREAAGAGEYERYQLVTDKAKTEELEAGKTMKLYRAAQLIDGKIYPPMSARVNGKLREPIQLGKWEQAEEHPEMATDGGYFKLDKGNGRAIEARYNPYFHASPSPLNDQFSSASARPNLITLEVEVPESELTSGYKADKAKDTVGMKDWHSGPVSGKLPGGKKRTVMLSRWDKPVRIVPDSEVAEKIAALLDGENLAVPRNVVTPSLAKELESRGVRIAEEGDDVRYQLGKDDDIETIGKKFDADIDNINELPTGYKFDLGRPSKYLLSAGFGDYPISLRLSLLWEKAGYERHPFAPQDLKGLVKALQKPVAVFKYSKDDMRNLIVEIEKEGKHFLVGITLNYNGLEINSVSGLFPKNNREWIKWIQDGKAIRIDDKEKIQSLIASLRTTPAESNAIGLNLNLVAKIVQDFENPALPQEKNSGDRYQLGTPSNVASQYYEEMTKGRAFAAMEAHQDAMRSLLMLQRGIAKEMGRSIEDFEDAYIAENEMSSANYAQGEHFLNAYYNPIVDAIKGLMKDYGYSRQQVYDYMMAKHGIERNALMSRKAIRATLGKAFPEIVTGAGYADLLEKALAELQRQGFLDKDFDISAFIGTLGLSNPVKAAREADDLNNNREDAIYDLVEWVTEIGEYRDVDFSGLTQLTGEKEDFTAAAQHIIDGFENNVSKGDRDRLWQRTNAATKKTLLTLREGGLMSEDTYAMVRDMYEYYIPLRGWSDTVGHDVWDYVQADAGRFGSVMKTAKGRKSKADDPVATIAWMGQRGIMQANRNLMKQRLLNLAQNAQSSLLTVSQTWIVKSVNTLGEEIWTVAVAPVPADATPAQAQMMIDSFERDMRQRQGTGDAKQVNGRLNVPYRLLDKEAEQHAVIVKEAGRSYTIYVNGNPRAAQAINGLLTDTGEGFWQKVDEINRFMASNFTQRNPAFILSNLSRDVIFSRFNVTVKEDKAYSRRFKTNQLFLLKAMPGLVQRHRKGKLDLGDPLDSLYNDFVMNGGETGYTNLLDIEQFKSKLDRLEKGKRISLMEAWDWINTPVEIMNKASENLSRFAAFMTSRQTGRSISRSAWDAKQVSVDFNKKGSGNGWGAGAARHTILFYNAAVQSLYQFGKLAKEHGKRFYPRIFALVAGGALMPLLVRLLANWGYGGEPDDYDNLPESTRRNNICIPLPDGKFILVPLPIELRAFYGMGELMTQWMRGEMKYDNVGLAIVAQMSELLPIDLSAYFNSRTGNLGLDLGATVGPDLLRPAFQQWRNADYFGLPIYRKNAFNENLPDYTKAYKGTNRFYVNLSEALNNILGGDKYTNKSGNYNNPAVWEFVLNAYFGGTYKTAMQSAHLVGGGIRAIKDEDPDLAWRTAPVLNRFVADAKDSRVYGRKINKEFYRYKDELEKFSTRLNGYKNEVKYGNALEYQEKMMEALRDPDYMAYRMMSFFEKRLKAVEQQHKLGIYDDKEASDKALEVREEAVMWFEDYYGKSEQ